ncbi:HAMP domain-containing sensor histidine kinase [Tardiphaga sp.]|uniref:sensor histidine kinase n=1 Tax=Tardiphaga sp. TaxID=1926292 RepID=UPI002602D6FB|nr:HAMP domain-containing sensor histidine kinase [Tardiphaga sp.]MDB5617265.1 two-component sensor histidine kinase [Tardiphaga sp.]
MNALIGRHQHALETKRRFVADAAHELRTPLAPLQIQIDNLRSQDLATPIREMATDLLAGIRRAVYSVNQLLTMARADASAERDLEEIEVATLIRFVASGFTSISEAKSVHLSVDVEDGIRVVSRPPDVQLVLTNLIDNALRYSEPGGEIPIGGRRDAGIVAITITDDGCGIPEVALPLIFDRFFKAASQDVVGTGLGLAIAKTAADRSGMSIAITNRPDARGVKAILEMPAFDAA